MWVTTGVATLPQSITVLQVQQQVQQQEPQSQQERVLLLQRVQQQVPRSQQAQRLLLFGHKLSKRTQPTRQLRELIFS